MAFLPVNLLNVQPAVGFDYPVGRYLLNIIGTEIRTNTSGDGQRLVLNLEIVMGPGPGNVQFQGRKTFHSFQLTEKGLPFLKRFFNVCGITEEFINQNGGNVDNEWLHGRQFCATSVKNGQYVNWTNEKPAAEWNQQPAPQAARAATAAPQAAPPPALLQPSPQAQAAPQPMAYVSPTPQPQYAPPPQQMAPAGLPTPQLPQPQGGIPVGIPAPVPPPGRVGQ
jgi:hypothetical protein